MITVMFSAPSLRAIPSPRLRLAPVISAVFAVMTVYPRLGGLKPRITRVVAGEEHRDVRDVNRLPDPAER